MSWISPWTIPAQNTPFDRSPVCSNSLPFAPATSSRTSSNTARVGRSAVSEEVVRRLSQPGAQFGDVQELVAGAAGRELLQTGDLSKGVFWAGMVQGLIDDIPTCQQLIDRIIAEADAIVDQRLASLRA